MGPSRTRLLSGLQNLMKRPSPRHSLTRILLASITLAATGGGALQAASNLAPPNILWHNKSTGENTLWTVRGSNFVSATALPVNSDDPKWQMVGTGDFNKDGNLDILWQNQSTGQNTVWYMKGTSLSSTAPIKSADDRNWKLAGVADFNQDGWPDLLWQNLHTAQNAVWLMKGVTPVSYHLIVSNGDPNWRIVATGDMDADGKPDLILHNMSTGQNAIWYMNGLTIARGELIHYPNGTEVNSTDLDWSLVGTGDFNGDGHLDLLWRHSTLGLNLFWAMNQSVFLSANYLSQQEYNTDWRICGQDLADSTWRLRVADYTWLRASVTNSPPQVVLTFKLPPNTGFGTTVQRRLDTATNWTTLTTGLKATNYTDSNLSLGHHYEYQVYREGFGASQYSPAEHMSAGLDAPAIEKHGKIVLLIDETLSSQLALSLDQLQQDLVGDGWEVVRYTVPRHQDIYSPTAAYLVNAYNITNLVKPLIRSVYTNDPAGTRAVLLIGHVPVPYSGTFSVDGHTCAPAPFGPDHQGAWAADMFYGDLDGTWTDSSANYTNCNFPEATNLRGDGKFDQDGIPSPFVMRLAVGRIDFARLPAFTSNPTPGVSAMSEAALIEQYLRKDHLFRFKQLSWQTTNPNAATVYGHFHDGRDSPIFENAANAAVALSADPAALQVGDFCMQRTHSYLWGFLSGSGYYDRVNWAIPLVEHTSASLANAANEPTAAFCMVLASFLGDWNLSTNNFLRSLLATPNYGLAACWTRASLWRFDELGLGEDLGYAQLRMVNDPKLLFYDHSRDLAILGDPTLRLHILAAPSSLTATSKEGQVELKWTGSETGAQYFVYRSASTNGPFTRISISPVNATVYTDPAPDAQQRVYLVRAIRRLVVSNGSSTNISQGAFAIRD
jgi:hypothetical protein